MGMHGHIDLITQHSHNLHFHKGVNHANIETMQLTTWMVQQPYVQHIIVVVLTQVEAQFVTWHAWT